MTKCRMLHADPIGVPVNDSTRSELLTTEQEGKENTKMLTRFQTMVAAVSAIILLVSGVASIADARVGPPGSMIYAHDETYRTVATPTNLPPHGKFDAIYVLGDGLAPVSESAPGDRHYNGGRWEARLVEFLTIDPMQFTNAEDILQAADNGQIAIGDVVARFVCPLIRDR